MKKNIGKMPNTLPPMHMDCQGQEKNRMAMHYRLDYCKKYCLHSPSIEESLLQDAVMRAIMQTAKQNIEVVFIGGTEIEMTL